MSDAELILIGGLLLAAGTAGALVADRVRVPGLILFLGLGMLVGSDGIGHVDFTDVELTRTLGTIGLVLILFDGGLSAGWREIRPVFASALSLAVIGTIATALIAGFAAAALFDLTTLEGLIVGSAVAATDSAAIFAVLRGSNLKRRLARSLEGESGLNDPVAVLLVTGFIAWIEQPGYGLADMSWAFAQEMSVGVVVGIAVGFAARRAFIHLNYPTPGLYPVGSMAAAATAFGLADLGHGSGFIAVYLAGLVLGTGILPGRGTVLPFHEGLAWVAQISLFFLLGLLVLPHRLGDVAFEGITLALVLIFVARPIATFVATATSSFTGAERAMLSWAGLRGAVPIWLATLPVIAGVDGTGELFNIVFFIVISSTLIQGFTFEPVATRLRVISTEPALPEPLIETGRVAEIGADVLAVQIEAGDAATGHMIKRLGLPREALVNLIVRDGEALLPRGSTVVEAGDELHVLVRRETRREIDRVTQTWREGPLKEPEPLPIGVRGAPQIFSVRPTRADDGDTGNPERIGAVEVAAVLRTRSDVPAAVAALTDGRFAVTGPDLIAVGGRRNLARWCTARAAREELSDQDRAWLQEAIGVIDAPGPR